MKVDARPLAGIEAKLSRAHQHLLALHGEMTAWDALRPHPWWLEPKVYDQGREHVYRLRFRDPIPPMWSAVLGEVVHDLRSALDQAVYWLSVDWTRREIGDSGFPVYRRRARFAKLTKKGIWTPDCGMHKIRGVGPGPQAFIEALQPYPQRYRRSQPQTLRFLHDLWNQDKHRLVHLWGLRVVDEKLRFPRQIVNDCEVGKYGRILHEGAKVLVITCDPPHAEVQMLGEVTAILSIIAGKRAGGGSVPLWGMFQTVADVVRKLLNAIDRQDAAISLTVWSSRSPAPF